MDLTGLDLDLDRWAPWAPQEVARLLEGVDATWYVLAGWALDLFHGRPMRAHDDIEIGVRADEFGPIRDALAGFELFVVREPASGLWRLDIIRENWDGDTWVYRRDPRIRLDVSRLVAFTDTGVPYCRPEVVVLFKAHSSRPKDEDDFRALLPLLDEDRRGWLAETLDLVSPGHHWLTVLRA